MELNPTLKNLGFSPKDRVAIIHADDIGMCQATLPAIADLFDFGLVSSAAVMVPCPWFSGAAAYYRENPEIDLGVHLTLNSEWESLRWAPISTVDSSSGLIDESGYFYKGTEPTQSNANLDLLKVELRTQIERAANAGIDPTHVDTHMFCLGHPRLFESYVEIGREGKSLPVVIRPGGPGWRRIEFSEDISLRNQVCELEEIGLPMIDDIYMMNLDTHENRIEEAREAFASLSPGITHFILHPARDTPELRAMAPDWRCRVADYEIFTSNELQKIIQSLGIQVIGYRALRDLMK